MKYFFEDCKNTTYKKFYITQNSFSSGTFRIRSPGTYIITEDIIFSPTSTRSDIPLGTGWFAAITVETNNVIIDGKGHSIIMGNDYYNNHYSSIFSHIELDNCPYPGTKNGILYGFGDSNFQGDNSFVAGNNILITNLYLGRSSHFGIHGHNNSNVTIKCVKINDFQVSGIFLGGQKNLLIENIDISGLIHPITVSPLRTSLYFLNLIFEVLLTDPQIAPIAQDYYNSLQQYVQENQERFNETFNLPQSTYYGIILQAGFNTFGTFPATPELVQFGIELCNGRIEDNIILRNINIHDLDAAGIETVAIGSQQMTPILGDFIFTGVGDVFGILAWNDAFDSQGNFSPNDFLKAQAFIMSIFYPQAPDFIKAFTPTNTPLILQSILEGNSELFFSQARPTFRRNYNANENRGVFGIQINGSMQVLMENITMKNISSHGNPGILLQDIPQGQRYINTITQERYRGNDVWFYVIEDSSRVTLKNSNCKGLYTVNGQAFAIDFIDYNKSVCAENLSILDVNAPYNQNPNNVNQQGAIWGIRDRRGKGCIFARIYMEKLKSQNVIPVDVNETNNVIINDIKKE